MTAPETITDAIWSVMEAAKRPRRIEAVAPYLYSFDERSEAVPWYELPEGSRMQWRRRAHQVVSIIEQTDFRAMFGDRSSE